MKNTYQECIEIEELDSLIFGNNEIMIGILLYLVNKLNKDNLYTNLYSFEIINYGFQNSYPVIGVKYIGNKKEKVLPHVLKEFEEIISSKSIKQFLEFCKKNIDEIEIISERIKGNNFV